MACHGSITLLRALRDLTATIFVDLHAAWRRALRGPSWFRADLRRSFDHSFDQVGGCWCDGLKNGAAGTVERAAAAAGRTPAADDASGQSDSTARVWASGIRQRPLVGWLGGWGGRHSRAGHRQSWADARRWFPRRCGARVVVAFLRMAKLWFGLQWVVVDRLPLIAGRACVTLSRYRMFVMKTPTPKWGNLILSNYGELYLHFFATDSLALELSVCKIWWPWRRHKK